MITFDTIIGYSSIKEELKEIADILKNDAPYKKLGCYTPKGLLLHGDPGVGKTLMATALINESGRKVFSCQKDCSKDNFIGAIKSTFEQAKANAPSIVFMDDMDKFSNGNTSSNKNGEEYVTIQTCINEIKDKDVFVLATVNDITLLPESLKRAGRFDRIIEVDLYYEKEQQDIILGFLKKKKIVENINVSTLARILDGHSCAEIETLINEAGIYAGKERAENISMKHLLQACLRTLYKIPAFTTDDDFCVDLSNPNNLMSRIVYHEAGHATVNEILCPNSVTLVCSHNNNKKIGGITDYHRDNKDYPSLYLEKVNIIGALGGKAGLDQKFGIVCEGSRADIMRALDNTKDLITDLAYCGLNISSLGYREDTMKHNEVIEYVVFAEVQKFYQTAKEIIASNMDFFEKIALNLAKKHILTTDDIQEIKSTCTIVPISI